jgi:hypothetical protein
MLFLEKPYNNCILFDVTVGHVQHAALGHVAESKQYGGLNKCDNRIPNPIKYATKNRISRYFFPLEQKFFFKNRGGDELII